MQFKTTNLLKGLPRKKLEVNPFHVLEIHSPLCLRPQPWVKLQAKKKKVGWSKRYFNSQTGNYKISVSLSVWIYVCLSVCLLFFYDNIVEVVNEF